MTPAVCLTCQGDTIRYKKDNFMFDVKAFRKIQ